MKFISFIISAFPTHHQDISVSEFSKIEMRNKSNIVVA
jgi:hypothetical protein